MTAPGASAESFRENIQAVVVECVGEKLRRQDLETFEQELDEALRDIPRTVKCLAWFAEQKRLYDAKCREYLELVRPELHRAIDTLIDKLENELATSQKDEQREATSLRTPQTPRTASNAFSAPSAPSSTFGPSQPRAPEAAMDALSGIVSSSSRSATMQAEDVRTASHTDDVEDLFGENGEDEGSPAPLRACADILSPANDAPGASKRRTGGEVTREESSKRRRRSLPSNNDASAGDARTTNLKPIKLADVKPDECIFRYKELPGYYVLRCNKAVCKDKHRAKDIYYFRAHPFQWNRAVNHFSGENHGIKKEDLMMKKYAREVSDATEECNLSNAKSRQPTTPKTPNSELPGPSDAAAIERPTARAPLTPASPSNNNSRDKGKQRASSIVLGFGEDDDDSSFNGDPNEGLQSSGSTVAEELSRSQPYPTRSRGSVPDMDIEMVEIEDEEESDGGGFDPEFPPIANWSKIPRRFAPS
ncbi:uncharacterized protein PG998_008441 [Apiospora kogelbergensis]|uniref:uncharacterized protein n=1 Tax=Apiospora kogelbergensis TaxID=1337665 RepID=UPI00313202C2